MSGNRLIVGLGSPHGDDQAGWRVIDHLHAAGLSQDEARAAPTPAALWDWCSSQCDLTVCDASDDGAAPGRIHRWRWPDDPFPARASGTHDLPLSEVLAIGVTLGCLPTHVTIWTISGAAFGAGRETSPEVLTASARLAEVLRGALCHA